jgi:hypothetical protein
LGTGDLERRSRANDGGESPTVDNDARSDDESDNDYADDATEEGHVDAEEGTAEARCAARCGSGTRTAEVHRIARSTGSASRSRRDSRQIRPRLRCRIIPDSWLRYQLRRVRRVIIRARRNIDKEVHAPLDPEVLAEYLDGTGIRWQVTGMYMFNAFLGYRLREPHDLDVQIVHEDLPRILTAMPSWQHCYVDAGAWIRWRGKRLAHDIRRVVSRPSRKEPWAVDWLVTTLDGDDWVYRYDPRVRILWSGSSGIDLSGIPCSPPEVALLYKSRMLRPKDSADFEALLPHLNGFRRAWLADAIALADPHHPWLGALRGVRGGSVV